MSGWAKVIEELSASLGLRQRVGVEGRIGTYKDFLLELDSVRRDKATDLLIRIRHGHREKGSELKQAFDLSQLGQKFKLKKTLQVVDDIVQVARPVKLFARESATELLPLVEALVEQIATTVGRMKEGCLLCSATGSHDLMRIEGVVTRCCSRCLEKFEQEGRELQRQYDALPLRLGFAFCGALVMALLGAATWAAIVIFTHTMHTAVGIGIGFAIGWVTLKCAGKGEKIVQVIAGIFTVLSLLAGELFQIAYYIQMQAQEEGGSVDWEIFLENTPNLLRADAFDAGFTLLCGLIGAFLAAAMVGRPKLGTTIER